MIEYSSDVHGFFYLFPVMVGSEGFEVVHEPGGIDRAPEGASKTTAAASRLEACRARMDPRSTAGGGSTRIHPQHWCGVIRELGPGDAHQLFTVGDFSAADAGPLRGW